MATLAHIFRAVSVVVALGEKMFLPNTGYAFETFVERTGRLRSKDRLFETFIEAMNNYGFDRVNFSAMQDLQLPPEALGFGLISTYPDDWRTLYAKRNFASIDPVLKSASALNLPFTWRQLVRHHPLTSKQVRFLCQAEAAGLWNGIGIPFNGATSQIAGVALATSHRSADHLKNMDLLAAFANQFYVVFKRIVGHANHVQPSLSPLTRRETEILRMIAKGKTDDRIAQRLTISDNTVSFFTRGIYRKLNVTNRVQAVVVAIASGIIDL